MSDPELIAALAGDSTRCAPEPPGSHSGAAGGSACGDLVRVSVCVDEGRVTRAVFDAEGCAALRACAAALCEQVEGEPVLEAAALGTDAVADLVGGLGAQGRHAAVLAADALHRALGSAAGSGRPLAPSSRGSERVLVALSGGVDSAVAALIEREAGADVVCVTLKLWADRRTDGERSCCSPEAVMGARGLAHELGLPHLTLDLEQGFRRRVVSEFVSGYERGETPNPCVACNGDFRLHAMLALADRLGAGTLVTGHYARIVDDGEGPLLAEAADPRKDQSYMLAALDPEALARLRFPLAGHSKQRVRELASAHGLSVASRRESQDLCFLAGRGRARFLADHSPGAATPGEVVHVDGRVLGRRDDTRGLTVGQRRGLGVAAGEPLYVIDRDPRTGRVVAGPRESLASDSVELRDVVLRREGARVDRVRLRYHARAVPCAGLELAAGAHPGARLELIEPVGRPAPGQTACLLDGDTVIGHATIARPRRLSGAQTASPDTHALAGGGRGARAAAT